MIKLQWVEADTDASCLRLVDNKEGASTRPIGLPVVEYLENRRTDAVGTYASPARATIMHSAAFPITGRRSSRTHRLPISPGMCCGTASQASPTTLDSPRSRSRPSSATRKGRSRLIRSRARSMDCSRVSNLNRPPTPLIAIPRRRLLSAFFVRRLANRRQRSKRAAPCCLVLANARLS